MFARLATCFLIPVAAWGGQLTLHRGVDLSEHTGEELTLRGFAYALPDSDQWALASDPGIRSCCVVKKDRQHTVVLLDEKLDAAQNQRVAEVHGVLVKVEGEWHLRAQVS